MDESEILVLEVAGGGSRGAASCLGAPIQVISGVAKFERLTASAWRAEDFEKITVFLGPKEEQASLAAAT